MAASRITEDFGLHPGSKYAVLPLSTAEDVHLDAPVQLGDGLWASSHSPTSLPDHWFEWLGKLRADELDEAKLFLVASRASERPADLDGENELLGHRLQRLFFGLLLAGDFTPHMEGSAFTGSVMPDGSVTVRRWSALVAIYRSAGSPWVSFDEGTLRRSAELASGIAAFEGTGEFERGWRILHAYFAGAQETSFGPRLHQFVRVLEGLILPDAGATKAQFKSRTELVLGPRHHALADKLYAIRSSVEHLHDATRTLEGPLKEAGMALAQAAFEADALAQRCLRRLLSRRKLREVFQRDACLAQFWDESHEERRAVWGDPFDMDRLTESFQPEDVTLRITKPPTEAG